MMLSTPLVTLGIFTFAAALPVPMTTSASIAHFVCPDSAKPAEQIARAIPIKSRPLRGTGSPNQNREYLYVVWYHSVTPGLPLHQTFFLSKSSSISSGRNAGDVYEALNAGVGRFTTGTHQAYMPTDNYAGSVRVGQVDGNRWREFCEGFGPANADYITEHNMIRSNAPEYNCQTWTREMLIDANKCLLLGGGVQVDVEKIWRKIGKM